MNLKNFIAGLTLLSKHYESQSSYVIGAEHDEFFAYSTDTPLSEQEVSTMYELGWHQYNTEEGEYNIEESWSAYL